MFFCRTVVLAVVAQDSQSSNTHLKSKRHLLLKTRLPDPLFFLSFIEKNYPAAQNPRRNFFCRTTRQACTVVASSRVQQDSTGERLNMSRNPNDDRSDSMNPNNDSYDDAQDNRSDQLNPNNERYQGDDQEDKVA